MRQKLLKAKTNKITRKKGVVDETGIVLVGTYKEKQLAWIKKHGVYNYPVKEEDELKHESCAKVKELWLYASAKQDCGGKCVFTSELKNNTKGKLKWRQSA